MKKKKWPVALLRRFADRDEITIDPRIFQSLANKGVIPLFSCIDWFGDGGNAIEVIGPHIRVAPVPKAVYNTPTSSPDRRVGMVATRLPQNPVRRAVRISGVDAELGIQRGDVDAIDSILATRDS